MTPAPCSTFSPSPEQADRLLTLYLDPSRSLSDLAQEAGAALPALARWLALPGTAAQLEALEQAAARRTRAVAAQHLPAAVPVLTAILGEHRRAQASGTLPADPELRRSAHETARRAAALLVRLARFNPAQPRAAAARELPAPAPAGIRPIPRAPRPTPTIDPATLTPLLNAAVAAADANDNEHTSVDHRTAGPESDDAATDALLERLAAIPDDCPDDQLQAAIAAALSPLPFREAG